MAFSGQPDSQLPQLMQASVILWGTTVTSMLVNYCRNLDMPTKTKKYLFDSPGVYPFGAGGIFAGKLARPPMPGHGIRCPPPAKAEVSIMPPRRCAV